MILLGKTGTTQHQFYNSNQCNSKSAKRKKKNWVGVQFSLFLISLEKSWFRSRVGFLPSSYTLGGGENVRQEGLPKSQQFVLLIRSCIFEKKVVGKKKAVFQKRSWAPPSSHFQYVCISNWKSCGQSQDEDSCNAVKRRFYHSIIGLYDSYTPQSLDMWK